MATYPAGIFPYTNRTATQTLLAATHTTNHNTVAAEVIAIETELGTNPKGSYPTVRDRLEGLAASIGTTHTQNTDVGSSSPTFYLNGASGLKIKGNGVVSVRNNTDTAYADFTCKDLICNNLNGISAATLTSLTVDTHTHANKGLLDTYTQTEANLASAVALKHTQNTDTGSTNETFQLNNGNVTSAKVKVDDLTPTIVDIRNGADSAFAPLRALEFRGELQANNADLNRPTIEYNEGTNAWQFSNDGVAFYDIVASPGINLTDTLTVDLTLTGTTLSADVIPGGVDHNQLLNYSAARHFTVGGSVNEIQYNNGTGGLSGEVVFYYNSGTDTLYVPNISVSGLIIGSIVVGGTTSPTWEINTSGNSFTIGTTGLTGDITVQGLDIQTAITNTHVAATAGTGISILGQAITNSAPDQTVAFTGGTNVTIGGTYPNFTITDNSQVSGSYLTSLSGAVLTDQTVGQTIGATGTRLTRLWVTDITCTNAISGSVTGNAGTVTNGVYTGDAGTVFLAPAGSAAALTSFPTLNQDTTGTAAKANALNSATTVVNVSSATAPTVGQVLTATSSTAATWQAPGATLTRATFNNASLTAGVLTITHTKGLSAPYTVMVTIFDNNSQQIIPDSITGATNTVAVDLSSYVTAGGGSIQGTWGWAYIA